MLLKRKKYSSYVTFPCNIYLVLEMDPYSFMECDQFISLGFLSKFSITCKERDKTRVFLILIFWISLFSLLNYQLRIHKTGHPSKMYASKGGAGDQTKSVNLLFRWRHSFLKMRTRGSVSNVSLVRPYVFGWSLTWCHNQVHYMICKLLVWGRNCKRKKFIS